MAEIRFSSDALDDMRRTKAYIAEELCSQSAALETIRGIMDRIRTLSDFPESGARLSSIVNIYTDYRFLVCGNYTAFYRYEQGAVYVIRVIYGRRDFMSILFNEHPKED